jgi:predicted lipoprotein with Yx(FWY)xxD motif
VSHSRIHPAQIDPPTTTARAAGRLRPGLAVGATLLMAELVAACGHSTSASTSATSAPPATTAPSTAPAKATQASSTGTIHAAKVSSVGTVLVDSSGRTVYVYTPDQQKAVTCTGACAKAWPPVSVQGATVAGSGIESSLLATIKAGAKTVVTYDHWPLYTFTGDTAAGQANGEGIGGTWFAVTPSGAEVKAGAAATSPTTAKKKSRSSAGGY